MTIAAILAQVETFTNTSVFAARSITSYRYNNFYLFSMLRLPFLLFPGHRQNREERVASHWEGAPAGGGPLDAPPQDPVQRSQPEPPGWLQNTNRSVNESHEKCSILLMHWRGVDWMFYAMKFGQKIIDIQYLLWLSLVSSSRTKVLQTHHQKKSRTSGGKLKTGLWRPTNIWNIKKRRDFTRDLFMKVHRAEEKPDKPMKPDPGGQHHGSSPNFASNHRSGKFEQDNWWAVPGQTGQWLHYQYLGKYKTQVLTRSWLLDHFIQEGELRTDYTCNGNWQDLNTWHHNAAQVTKNDTVKI